MGEMQERGWPEVVFFDAMGTIIFPAPSFAHVFAQVCEEQGEPLSAAEVSLGFAQADVPALMDAGKEREGASVPLSDTRPYWTSVYQAILRTLGIDRSDLPDRIYDRFSEPSTYALYDDVRSALDLLSAGGRRLGVVSNFEPWLLNVLEYLEISAYFGVTIVSSVEEVAKPDPAIYRLALERASVDASAAVHVGDSVRNDIDPCRAIGLPAVFLDRDASSPGFDGARIETLTELPNVLERLRSQPVGEACD